MMVIGLHDISGIDTNADWESRLMGAVAICEELAKGQPALDSEIVGMDAAQQLRGLILEALDQETIAILPPQSVEVTLRLVQFLQFHFDTVMLDPWYNKGFGGIQQDYMAFFLDVIQKSGEVADHVYFWGFPEIIAPFVERIPDPLKLTCWLTWYYKNNPSVIRGWRSSQNACLHLSHPEAILHPERFLNGKQLVLKEQGKLRYMPGPTSVLEDDGPPDVIEEPLLVGFVGRAEQTGHPSQKPRRVYDQLLQMSMSDKGTFLDPMAGSGTSGIVAKNRGFRAILCDKSDEYTRIMENRLSTIRLPIEREITEILKTNA
jgi:site-specific DNA-methyltransferase (adenine-specific)